MVSIIKFITDTSSSFHYFHHFTTFYVFLISPPEFIMLDKKLIKKEVLHLFWLKTFGEFLFSTRFQLQFEFPISLLIVD